MDSLLLLVVSAKSSLLIGVSLDKFLVSDSVGNRWAPHIFEIVTLANFPCLEGILADLGLFCPSIEDFVFNR